MNKSSRMGLTKCWMTLPNLQPRMEYEIRIGDHDYVAFEKIYLVEDDVLRIHQSHRIL